MTTPQDRTGAAWRAAEKARNRRRRAALWVVAVGLLLVLVSPALRRALSTPEPAPAELLGVWKTTAAKYRDRSFEVAPRTVMFQTGPGRNDFTIHSLERIDRHAEGDSVLYTLRYRNQGDLDALSLYYAPGPPARIRLQGQPKIAWTRAPDDR